MSKPAPPGPRILVLTASVGAGHSRAAQAVDLALRHISPDAHVRTVDAMALTNPLFRQLYSSAYLKFVSKTPNLAGAFYALTDKAPSPDKALDRLRMLVEHLNARRLARLLVTGSEKRGQAPDAPPRSSRGSWDLVVHTHFLPAELVARLKRKRVIDIPHATVVTDFDAHGAWVNSPTERYFTATAEAGIALESWGVAPEQITLTGIPIHPSFYQPKSGPEARAALNLSTERPVVLILAGGAGTGPVELVFKAALKVKRPAHFVVICGKNAALKDRVEACNTPKLVGVHRTTILGFTDRIDEYAAAADIVVTKPGGLTTAEILACGGAMAIINPIPGQESRNSDYLLELGAAVKIGSTHVLPYKLGQLLDDERRLAGLRSTARLHGRPRAALDIASHLLNMLGQPIPAHHRPSGTAGGPSARAKGDALAQ